MARAHASVPVRAAPPRVWAFVHDYANWAALLPGYQGHRHGGGAESVWSIRGDVGMVSRLVDLAVAVVEASEDARVRFTFRGLTERVSGEGEFTIEPAAGEAGAARLTLAVEVRAGGPLGPLIDALLAARLPAMLGEFAPALARRIEATAPA